MPRSREKDYTLRNSDNQPANIEHYRTAPWRQTYAKITYDFRRWLFIGRPKLNDEGYSFPDSNGVIIPLVHAGRDGMVEAIRDAVHHIPSVEAMTKNSYCHDGLPKWFEFLDFRNAAGQPIYELTDIDKEVISSFIHWLKHIRVSDTESGHLSYVSAKQAYKLLKSVFQHLVRRKSLPMGLFPKNPFPHSNRASIGFKAYSKEVMTMLMGALFRDIKAIRKGLLPLAQSDVLGIYLLAIAARTGRNTTPLLELTRDALLPHPIKPDKLGLLVTYKRRGGRTSIQPFKKTKIIEDLISLPMDAMTLYLEVVSMTASLVDEVPQDQRNLLWLFRKSGCDSGKVSCLTTTRLFDACRKLIQRHELTENGTPLSLNISRFRKTFAQRIWYFTGGDIISTSDLLGNTPPVAETYIATTPEMVANFRRLGILMHADWAGKLDDLVFLEELAKKTGIPNDALRDIAVGYNNTGVGRCTDPKHGDLAPGDGSLCTRWIECFHCPNQLVMESDLYRLFSFYFLLIKERNYISRERWESLYAPVVLIIDEEIIKQNLRTKDNPKGCFDPYRVNKSRTAAEVTPHRMWQDRSILGSVS